jgi:hypothetical protein
MHTFLLKGTVTQFVSSNILHILAEPKGTVNKMVVDINNGVVD